VKGGREIDFPELLDIPGLSNHRFCTCLQVRVGKWPWTKLLKKLTSVAAKAPCFSRDMFQKRNTAVKDV